jgi:ankyrin repeat protein
MVTDQGLWTKQEEEQKRFQQALRERRWDCALSAILCGADPNDKQGRGYDIAVQVAVRDGRMDILRALLRAGASPEPVVSHDFPDGRRPIHWAVVTGQPEAVNILLDAGASIEARTPDGRTALGIAVVEGNPEIVSLLLSRGADLSGRDNTGLTPVDLADKCNDKAIKVLLSRAVERGNCGSASRVR